MDQPRCGHIPPVEHRGVPLPHPAVVRVLHSHNAGVNPEYRDRCLIHVRQQLGPSVATVWNAVDQAWLAVD